MKKRKVLLFGVLSAICLTGCNDAPKDDKKDENFKLEDPTDTSQLSENCKAYVDAMREQEEENGEENKYKMDGYAFQPKDEVKIDAKDEDGNWVYRDAIDYTDEEKKDEQQAQKSDKSKGVPLKFSCENGFSAESYKIQVSTNNSFTTDVIEVDATPDTEVRVKNLFQNTKYYWRVVTSAKTSSVSEFETGDYPRWIDAADLFNVRDAGGYMTSSGKRVKQGLIFRGGEITSKAWGGGDGQYSQTKHQFTGSEAAKDIFRNVMKIGNELDLRRTSDLTSDNNYSRCFFAEKDDDGNDDIVWTNVQLNSWENFLTNYKDIQDCFEAFAHADEKPVYYHCHGGADRTGTLGLFLLGALGVSYSDIVIDYELTSYSSIIAINKTSAADSLRRHYQRGTYDHWNEFIPNVIKTNGWDKTKPLQDNIVNFLVSVAGVPQDTINRYQKIMLED